jgi:hypothetical protein
MFSHHNGWPVPVENKIVVLPVLQQNLLGSQVKIRVV